MSFVGEKFVPEPMGSRSDPRVRLEKDGFRVVAPSARRANGVDYPNGPIVIERAMKDSLGVTSWTLVAKISDKEDADIERSSDEALRQALFALLGGFR